jgi:hypothetical protein
MLFFMGLHVLFTGGYDGFFAGGDHGAGEALKVGTAGVWGAAGINGCYEKTDGGRKKRPGV